MTINDFLDYCIDYGTMVVEIYNLEKAKVVWSGNGDEIPPEYLYEEINSWDVPTEPGKMTFNIN